MTKIGHHAITNIYCNIIKHVHLNFTFRVHLIFAQGLKVSNADPGTVDKLSLEQQFHKSNMITFVVIKLEPYTQHNHVLQQADKMLVNFNILKNLKKVFDAFNKVTVLLQQYECIQVSIFSKSRY